MSRITLTTLTTGAASCVLLVPSTGCRPPSANVELPEAGARGSEPQGGGPCKPCATPKARAGSPDDQDPPVILGARFVARDRVQLTFSEPLAPVEAVNPRQFRLSHAYSMVDVDQDRSYASGYYYDLAGADVYEAQLVVIKLEVYADQPEVLALTLNRPVPQDLCDQLLDRQTALGQAQADGATQRGQIGLFLHYTTRGSDGIRDRVNNPLGDLGADWALNFGGRHKTVYGSEPVTRLDLLPQLACPDASMAGGGGPPGPI